MKIVEEAPAVAGPLELKVSVGLRAICGDALENLGRLISAGQQVEEHVIVQ
jgi:hypothetical protein